MEKARRQIATLVGECNTLLEILDELDYDRYFRGLMRVLSDEALSHLLRDDAALIRITDYTREKLADWHLLQWICSLTSSRSSSEPACVSNSSTGAKGWR